MGRALAELAGASLAAEHRPGRCVMHDLVRGYAAGQARQVLGEAGIRAAIERSLDHYLHTVIRPLPVPPPPFAVAPSARPVAAGRGNRDIASELSVSPKAVSVHVFNILASSASPPAPKAAATVYRLHVLDGQ